MSMYLICEVLNLTQAFQALLIEIEGGEIGISLL